MLLKMSYSKEAFYIQDGNAIFHALMNLPPTFEGSLQSLDHMVAKKHFVFSTDSYHDDFVKAQERLRCGVSQRYIIGGPATRPSDFNSSWQIMRTRTNSVTTCEIPQLESTQEETDPRIVLYLLLYVAQHTRRLWRILNVSELEESKEADYCTVLCLYMFTGGDVTSTFKGKGKVGPLKELQSNPKYHAAFRPVKNQ
ncbi:unnamed protein product [Arctogadus glacialis]